MKKYNKISEIYEHVSQNSMSNGGLMRVAPLACFSIH